MFNVCLMEHDPPSRTLKTFFRQRWSGGIAHINVSLGNHDSSMMDSCEIEHELGQFARLKGKPLTVYGHGSFHHYTYGLTRNIMPQRTNEFLYIHIDLHTDAGKAKDPCLCDKGRSSLNFFKRCGGKALGCGSFVEEIAKSGAKNFLFIGTDSACGWNRKEWVKQDTMVEATDLKSIIANELRMKRCDDVYVSMDLDVLDRPEVATGYGRGKINLDHLLDILTVIQENKNILAADILGLCRKTGGSYYDICRHYKMNAKEIPCFEDYYEGISLLTYGIIASHLCGRYYGHAKEIRKHLMKKIEEQTNGRDAREIMGGLTF